MIGQMVGNYKITEKIGEGGMGAVYKGIDVMLEREVAIKMLRPELANNPQIVERFRSEAVTLAKLNHPNIATLYSFLRQNDDFFMVMEFVRGDTLDEVITASGPMAPDRAVQLFCQGLEGIDHAHRLGIIHRDIKPANMMMTDTGALKVMDFGIARVLGTNRMTKTGHLIGTIEYMSPEQIRGLESDARSDIYSLGILLYEMLTGRVPFSSTSEYELMRAQIEEAPVPPRDLSPHVPLPLEQSIMKSLAKKPEARYQTAGEFRAALEISMRTATNPLAVPAEYRTPSTRIDVPPAATTPSRDVPKETRLAAETGEGLGLRGEEMRPTRLDGPAGRGAPAAHPVVRPASSFFDRLNWKHLVAAVAVLLVLILVPAAFIIRGALRSEPQTPPVQPPAEAEATETAPVQSAVPENTSTDQTTPESPGDQSGPAGEKTDAGGSASDSGRTSKTRSPSKPETDASPPTTSETPPPTVEKPPQQAVTSTQKPEEKPATAAAKPEKKDEKKVDPKDEKQGGVGGFFKKLNPFKGEKKKEPKKP
jgi:serine/threonine protein kinase